MIRTCALTNSVYLWKGVIKQWLNPIDFQLERLQLQRQRSMGTFDWLVTTDAKFQTWLKSTTPETAVLWLCDRPGTGKSVAVSLMLQAIETHCHRIKDNYAYCFGK